MIRSGNWTTPSIPSESGQTPYLGKPPFHFWAIAACYKLFGVDEWSTRLPSFIAALLSVLLLSLFAINFLGKTEAAYGALITLTSGGFFIFSGSSMIDVTLTMTIALAIVAYALSIKPQSKKTRYLWAILFALGAALGFLTKGPVSIALVGIPIIGASIISGDYKHLKSFPWITSLFVFILITAPWFIVSELDNPGFLKYFFWNENIARYLFSDYGDRYGSGHQHPFGMSFIFLALCFLPWTPFAIIHGITWYRKNHFLAIRNLSFPSVLLLLWALVPALFFAFSKQLHSGYILPGIPALSLLVAKFFTTAPLDIRMAVWTRLMIISLWIVYAGALLIGLIIGHSPVEGMISLLLGLGGLLLCRLIPLAHSKTSFSHSFFLRYATITATALCAVFIAVSPIVSKYHSSESAIKTIADESYEKTPTIGVFTQNTFSHYWVAAAWKTELSKQVIVEYFNQNDPPHNILVEQKEISKLPVAVKNSFRTKKLIGEWAWLEAIIS